MSLSGRFARHDDERAALLQRDIGCTTRSATVTCRGAMAATVPIEQGQMIIPAVRVETEAGDAPRSLSSNMRTCASHRAAPTERRSARASAIPLSVASRRQPCAETTSQTVRSALTTHWRRRTAYGAPDAPVTATTSAAASARDRERAGMQKAVDQHHNEEGDTDHAVHREERRIQAREIPAMTKRARMPIAAPLQRRRHRTESHSLRSPATISAITVTTA